MFHCTTCNLPSLQLECGHTLHVKDFTHFLQEGSSCPHCHKPPVFGDSIDVVEYLQSIRYFSRYCNVSAVAATAVDANLPPVDLLCGHSLGVEKLLPFVVTNRCPDCGQSAELNNKLSVVEQMQKLGYFERYATTKLMPCPDDKILESIFIFKNPLPKDTIDEPSEH